jgi:hypothetical protein
VTSEGAEQSVLRRYGTRLVSTGCLRSGHFERKLAATTARPSARTHRARTINPPGVSCGQGVCQKTWPRSVIYCHATDGECRNENTQHQELADLGPDVERDQGHQQVRSSELQLLFENVGKPEPVDEAE